MRWSARALLICALCALAAGKPRVDLDSEVITLDGQNWERHTAHGVWLVKFYAPWCAARPPPARPSVPAAPTATWRRCGHCKKLAPVYERVARHFHVDETRSGVKVGKVDGTQDESLLARYGVDGYPTVLLIRDGEKAAVFKGARTFDALRDFALDPTPSTPRGESGKGDAAGVASPRRARASRVTSALGLTNAWSNFDTRAFSELSVWSVVGAAAAVGLGSSACFVLCLCMTTRATP